MAGASPKYSLGLAVFIEARFAEAGVRADVVLFEVKTVLDQRRASKSVIAHAVATNPGIQESQREEKQENEPALRIGSLRSARAERLTFHEQKSVLEECRERKLLRSHFQNKQPQETCQRLRRGNTVSDTVLRIRNKVNERR